MEIPSSSMRFSWRSRVSNIIYGERSIRMVKWWTYFFRSDVMERPRSGSLSGCWGNIEVSRERLLRINCEATTWLIENLSLKRFTTHRSTPTIDASCHTNLREWGSGACVSSNRYIKHNDFWVRMLLSIIYLILDGIWCQLRTIDISDCGLLRLGKRQWQYRSS